MKVQLETITDKLDRSFNIMLNPRLSDLFFWHYHPEYELVYIEGADGPRRVGEHIGSYTSNDLVLIGANIPHLNFDYGVTSEYRKVVVHLKKEFVDSHFKDIPELASIDLMFKKSMHGMVFKGALKEEIGQSLFALAELSDFEQHQQLVFLLHRMATEMEYSLLHEYSYTKKHSGKEQQRLSSLYAFIDANYHRKIDLEEIAEVSALTKEAFCRYFKGATSYTFVEFLNRYRISQSKRLLMSGKTVSEACYRSGFESLSYFNRIFKRVTQENPTTFRKKYLHKKLSPAEL